MTLQSLQKLLNKVADNLDVVNKELVPRVDKAKVGFYDNTFSAELAAFPEH